jgi:Fe-S cluster assembly protein SufD
MANTFVFQQKDSCVSLVNFSLGAKFARDDVMVTLQEAGSECRTAGFYRLTNDNQYIDNHINIDHAAPRSCSEMVYKGVLDKKSRAVFNGRLYVGTGAQKIEAQQQNHNLLLSNVAEVYSKPELEIYADDVKCKHGATTGQLDQDALFYLRARGIEKTEAVNLLLQAFAADILQKITHADIKAHIEKTVNAND